jgi:hypothetical protein
MNEKSLEPEADGRFQMKGDATEEVAHGAVAMLEPDPT